MSRQTRFFEHLQKFLRLAITTRRKVMHHQQVPTRPALTRLTALPHTVAGISSRPQQNYVPLTIATLVIIANFFATKAVKAKDENSIDENDTQYKLQLLKNYVRLITTESGTTLTLTDNEYSQLSRLIDNEYVTPEARVDAANSKMPFEIKRAVIRALSLQLMHSDNMDAAYHLFTKGQPATDKLSFESFVTLARAAQQLPESVKQTQHTAAFLTTSEKTRALFQSLNLDPPFDSEQFLTAMASQIITSPSLMPATNDLNTYQRKSLQLAFLKDTHLRHIMYTEGGANMLVSLRKAISEGNISRDEFISLWVWRWRVNLFGFQAGPGAKYYTQTTHNLVEAVVSELLKLFDDPDYNPLPGYLEQRANMAGYQAIGPQARGLLSLIIPVNRLTEEEMILHKQFFGHLVAMFDITDATQGRRVLTGLNQFLEQAERANQLLQNYNQFTEQDNVKTPTYTPAIYKSAENILRDLGHTNSVELATVFTCQVLHNLHKLDLRERIYACRNLAWRQNLQSIIEHWLSNDQKMTFAPNEKFEITPDYLLEPEKGLTP